MASSDDEAEVKPQVVSNYHFEDEIQELVSLSVLPIIWNENERTGDDNQIIYLKGTTDNGLQQIYKPIIAWKFDLTNEIPEILVLSKDRSWIRLQKPRKSFEDIIRTLLITVYCLSHAKRNPEATGKSIWDALSRVFSLYEVRPSQNDLVDHMDLISEALKRDDVLAKSKFLVTFLKEKPTKRKMSNEAVQTTALSGFIVDDMTDDMVEDEEDDEEDELFDFVCSFCDNGGDILCCEGECMRSFHATVDAGEESHCASLGLTEDEVEAMQNFFCKNCENKQHQCFVCGKLGSSDRETRAEVFRCVSATCGHFYHPHCVSKLLFRDDEVAADQLQKSIIAGESFTCPLHKCNVCKQGEIKEDSDLQFAVCRRCPKAYHRKCLPREIAFEDKLEEDIITRAWEDLLPNHRILIYCLEHEIDDEIGTPIRDHIVFPGEIDDEIGTPIRDHIVFPEEKKTTVEGSRKKHVLAMPAGKSKDSSIKSRMTSKVPSQGNFSLKALKRVPSTRNLGLDSSRKVKATDVSRKSLKGSVKSLSVEVNRSSSADIKKTSLGDRLYALVTQGTEQTKLGKQDNLDSKTNKTVPVKPLRKKLNSELPSLDADSERRLLSLMKDAASSVSVEDIQKKHKIPSTHAYSSKSVVDKAITMGKVEGSVEAIRTALKKLDVDGSSIEDAKAVCEPEVLNQILKWKNKLKVYLAPFLHGNRYSSFGRHFTKPDKLQKIVDKLHWYVNDGDMIVDFCCGANHFSCLMKKKLEEVGKKCKYKNFDMMQTGNDFNFEQRDWMTVKPKELASGSQLIMGLNPPFGVKAALANKFINKALEFKPKLLILIVPRETERLDRKKTPYELVWEDDMILSGKSFYLPGSVDENDKQIDQWNLKAPPLYLWSRHDSAAQHKAVAEKHGHISKQQEQIQLQNNCYEAQVIDHPKEAERGDASVTTDLPLQTNEVRELRQEAREDEGGFSDDATERQRQSSHGHGNSKSYQKSRKRKHGDDDCQQIGKKGTPCTTPANVTNSKSSSEGHSSISTKMPSCDDIYQCDEMPHSSPENRINVISSLEGPSSKPMEQPPLSEIGEDDYQRFDDGTSHHSAANVIDGGSSLHGLSFKSVDLPSYTGFDDNVHQHFGDKGVSHCSPINTIAKTSLEDHSSKYIEVPSHTGFGSARQHFEPAISTSHMQIGTAYDGTQAGISNNMGRNGASLAEQFTGHGRNTDSAGYRPFPSTERESDIGQQARLYGRQDFAVPAPGYGQKGSLPSHVYGGNLGEASYRTSTSAMDRYAPRLGEFNDTRMGSFSSEPFIPSRSSFFDPRAPQPGSFANRDFDPGFRPPFPHQRSGGWLDD